MSFLVETQVMFLTFFLPIQLDVNFQHHLTLQKNHQFLVSISAQVATELSLTRKTLFQHLD